MTIGPVAYYKLLTGLECTFHCSACNFPHVAAVWAEQPIVYMLPVF